MSNVLFTHNNILVIRVLEKIIIIAGTMTDKENGRRCFKCGCSPAVDNVRLFRFPKPGHRNLVRCKLWAKFVFPERNIISRTLQYQLHGEHRMLCDHHFNDQDFTDGSKQRLLRFSIPCHRENQRKICDRVTVPVDHEYVLSFAHNESTENIDLRPQLMPSIHPQDIYNNMMRYNKKLIHDLDDLSHQAALETSFIFDQYKQAKVEQLSHERKSLSYSEHYDQVPKLKDVSEKDNIKPASFPDEHEQTRRINELGDGKTDFLLRDQCEQTPCVDEPFDQRENNKRKISDRIAVPVDHEYNLSFARNESTQNTDFGPQSMPSIHPEDIYNNMMRFNKKLIHDLDDLSHQAALETSSRLDQCNQAPNLEVLSEEKIAFILPDQCEQTPWIDEPFRRVSPEAGQLLHNCGKTSQLSDKAITETSQLPHKQASSIHYDSYTRFGLYIGNELRKYDAITLGNVKKAIYRVIREADTRSRQRHGD